MRIPFKNIVEIRAAIQRELNDDPYIGIARINIIHQVQRKCGCSEYAVMKQINSLENAGLIQSIRRRYRVSLFKTLKGVTYANPNDPDHQSSGQDPAGDSLGKSQSEEAHTPVD